MRAGFVDRMCTGGAPGAGAGAVVGPDADAGEGENDEDGEGGVEVIVASIRLGIRDPGLNRIRRSRQGKS